MGGGLPLPTGGSGRPLPEEILKIAAKWWPMEYLKSAFQTVFMRRKLEKKSQQKFN
jgi:hypothetical protein